MIKTLGYEFGVLLAQKMVEISSLKDELAKLTEKAKTLTAQVEEYEKRLEEFQRMTGRS